MIDRIYGIATATALWQNDSELPDYFPFPSQSVEISTNTTESAYLVGEDGFTAWDDLVTNDGAYIIGSWDSDNGLQEGEYYDIDGTTVLGAPAHPATADYTTWVRPLGNDAGKATGVLDSPRWQGHAEQKFLEANERYPSTKKPFSLMIQRQNIGVGAPDWDSLTQYTTGDYAKSGGATWQASQDSLNQTPYGGSPYWTFINTPGWGWKVTMLSDDPVRDITARAVGVYSDAECTSYLYTTGAFVDDGGGTYFTECPVGQRTATPDQVNFALLLGAAQEGYFNLSDGGDSTEALFWSSDQ